MADSPLISVIVPLYNKQDYLEECLSSILHQTFTDFECIVVNDGSTDCSQLIVESIMKSDSRIKLFNNENHGVIYSRNFGIMHSSGKYILPLDADDYISSTYLERIAKHMEEHPECSLYYGRWRFIGHNSFMMNQKFGKVKYTGYKNLLNKNAIHSCSAFRRKDVLEHGLYDETMEIGLEDWEFLIRLLYHNDNVYYDPTISLYYRQFEQSRSTDAIKNKRDLKTSIIRKNIEKYLEFYADELAGQQELTQSI